MRHNLRSLAAVLCLLLPLRLPAQRNLAGATEARLALERLNVTGSVLMIAAHPDDENTALLASLARGRKVRTGYLSLTRGEGGQNLIGPEQGLLLGLIRTRELLAARRIDGAEQFFTDAVDFGFTKTAEEAFAKWGREKVLGDVVYVIRKFQPDVIVLRFSGTPRDGHGHHQASAILGREAFTAAADPKRFPDQLTELKPWQAKRVMWNVFAFTPEQQREAEKLPGRIEMDLGAYNPQLGFSYAEIAGMSRSQHQSQGMGAAERRGPQKNYLTTVAGDPPTKDLMDGVSLRAADPKLAALLRQAADGYRPEDPSATVRALLQARPLIEERRRGELDAAIGLCTGLWLDASASRATAVDGSSVVITTEVVNRSSVPMRLERVRLGELVVPAGRSLDNNSPQTHTITYSGPLAARPIPRGAPEAGPALSASFDLAVDGVPVTFVRPVWHRYVDKVRGELTRPFVPVPPVSVSFAERTVIFPSNVARTINVQVRSWGAGSSGNVRLQMPSGWKAEPSLQAFELKQAGEEQTLAFSVTPPGESASVVIRAVADVRGRQLTTGVQFIEYPHIPPIAIYSAADASLVRTDVRVLSKRVGYITGAGDLVPEALRQIGCEVVTLNEDDLTRGNLSGYDAIVTGVRAYNTRADLRANMQRLLDYVSAGGTYVVQYNTAEGGPFEPVTGALDRIGPYPIKTGRDRVTVEEAPVEFLRAKHPLLSAPNQITQADFSGWVQERGLYFASEWDPKYETVIACSDPGEKSLPGGLLYARYGKGVYVFTAYSWFRQLPAGVPGAFRIFANLISAGKSR